MSRTEGSGGTWLDPEEMAYPSGALRHSRRRARVRCPDGKLRTVRCGIADTAFSIPASCCFKGTRVAGFVHSVQNSTYYTGQPDFIFTPYAYRKNWDIFPTKEESK